MKNTFYRPETIDTMEMEKIIAKLMEDLREIKSRGVSEEDAVAYARKMLQDAKALPRNEKLYFLGLASPEEMPGDSRVLYFYRPTYISCAILMQMKLKNLEKVTTLDGFDEIFRSLLHGQQAEGF